MFFTGSKYNSYENNAWKRLSIVLNKYMNGCLFSTKRYSGSVAIYVRVIIFEVEEIVPSEKTITDYIMCFCYFKLDFKSYWKYTNTYYIYNWNTPIKVIIDKDNILPFTSWASYNIIRTTKEVTKTPFNEQKCDPSFLQGYKHAQFTPDINVTICFNQYIIPSLPCNKDYLTC